MRIIDYVRDLSVLALFSAILFASCGDDSSDPVIEEPDAIAVNQTTASSFSAKITGTFREISKADIALGNHGVLFCPKTDKAEEIFNAWKNGNDNPGCSISPKGTFSGETYSCTIEGLSPETEYSYCLFLQSKGNSGREISAVYSFTTTGFNPQFAALRFGNVHYIDAEATLGVTMDAADANGCTLGVMVAQQPEVNENNAQFVFDYSGVFGRNMVVKATGLKPDSVYYCRPFARYASGSGADVYICGPESSFSTARSSQMAVDLGLPSGIMWANCDLGESKFYVSFSITTPFYMWGSMKELSVIEGKDGSKKRLELDYEYYDKKTQTYTDLGEEISGTQYDVARQKLGGKWRMPTKADVEELRQYTSIKSRTVPISEEYNIEGEIYQVYGDVRVNDVYGSNNNHISFMGYEEWWCGTAYEDDHSVAYVFDFESMNGTMDIFIGAWGRVDNGFPIRPVWDPRD